MSNTWNNITADQMKELYPYAAGYSGRFLWKMESRRSMLFDEETGKYDTSYLGIDKIYTQELLSDENFLPFAAELQYYRSGLADRYTRNSQDNEAVTEADILYALSENHDEAAFMEIIADDYMQSVKQGKSFVEYVNSQNQSEYIDNWRSFWSDISVEKLQTLYPSEDENVLERFITDVKDEIDSPYFREGNDSLQLIKNYPRALIIDDAFYAAANYLNKYNAGYRNDTWDIEYYNRNGEPERAERAKHELEITKKMPAFFNRVLGDFTKSRENVHVEQRHPEVQNTPDNQNKNELLSTPKALKKEIERSLTEFKSQNRDYHNKWEQWRNIKSEWLDLAFEENNLTDRAQWSIDAYKKQITNVVNCSLTQQIKDVLKEYSYHDVYAALQPSLDADGHYLSSASESLTGLKVESEYPTEDNLQYFEAMNGFGRLRFIEAAKFGERHFEMLNAPYETMSKYIIHSDTEQFKAYHEQLFKKAVEGIMKSAHLTNDLKDHLTAVADLRNIQMAEITPSALPQNGWVSADETVKKFTHYVDDEARYYERNKIPESVDHCIYADFGGSPDSKIPDAPLLETPPSNNDGGVDKILNVLKPARATERLQSELKIILSNTEKIRDYGLLLDKSMEEMKNEITQMRGYAEKAKQEIAGGKHFDDWMKLNLKPELSDLGLDPDNATIRDLTDKFSQYAIEAQPAQAQAFAFELE